MPVQRRGCPQPAFNLGLDSGVALWPNLKQGLSSQEPSVQRGRILTSATPLDKGCAVGLSAVCLCCRVNMECKTAHRAVPWIIERELAWTPKQRLHQRQGLGQNPTASA